MPERPSDSDDRLPTGSEERCGAPTSGRLGIGVWLPVSFAIGCGGIAAIVSYHRPDDSFKAGIVAGCAGVGLASGGVIWPVDRFGPRPDHSYALQVVGPGAIFLLLTVFSCDRRIWREPWIAVAIVVLALWCGAFAASSARRWLGYPDKRRLTQKLTGIGALGLAALLSCITARSIIDTASGRGALTVSNAIFAGCVLVWIAVSVILWAKHPHRFSIEAAHDALAWPLALLLHI